MNLFRYDQEVSVAWVLWFKNSFAAEIPQIVYAV